MSQRLLVVLAAAALSSSPAARAQPSVASLLPETTVLALHASPEGVDASTLASLLDDLDVERAADALRKLGALIEGAADLAEATEDGPLDELAAECPELADALEAAGRAFGPTAVGVSVSRFDPVPDLVLASRPAHDGAAEGLVAAAVECFGGTVLGREGTADVYLLFDGTDLPLLAAASEGFVVVSTDPELVRGALRRAHGSSEPSFATTRLGALSRAMTARGVGVSLNLAAAADALELYRGLLGEAPEAGPGLDRFVTTLRVLGGYAWHATVDSGGVVVESVAAYDARLAAEAGEGELLDLLTCDGCELGAADLLPPDAVALSGGVLPLRAFVAWLDSWLADLRAAGLVDADLRGLVARLLGVDLDAALLDWVGDSWHAATLDVIATDARSWLHGAPSVLAVPVASEDEARRGVALWLEALRRVGELGEGLAEGAPVDLRLGGAVAVRERSYRGVDYVRVRAGTSLDLGVGVLGGHLLLARPAASLHAVIDVYLGSYRPVGRAWQTYESLALEGTAVDGYRIADVPAFLRGLAQVTDLAAGPLATAAWLGASGVAGELERDAGPDELPTYDELIALADVVTEALELLADRTGVAIGTTELRGGARFTTWRLPLR